MSEQVKTQGINFPTKEIQQLVDASLRSFTTLEPWTLAESEDPEAKAIVSRIKPQVQRFCRALDHSEAIAVESYKVANHAQELFGALARAHELTTEELKVMISETQGQARGAKKNLEALVDELRDIRRGFIEISKDLEKKTKANDAKATNDQKFVDSKQGTVNAIDFAAMVADFAQKLASMMPLLYSSGAVEDMPSILFMLPVILPIVESATEKWGKQLKSQVEERRTEAKKTSDVLVQLKSSMDDLERLELQAGLLVSWWVTIDTEFGTTVDRIGELRNNAAARLRMQKIEEEFGNIAKRFLEYKTALVTIQDYYPPGIRKIASQQQETN